MANRLTAKTVAPRGPRTLAQIMATGWFRQVHVKSRQSRRWRSLLVARRAVFNQMRGPVGHRGERGPGDQPRGRNQARQAEPQGFAGRVREMVDGEPELMAQLARGLEPLLAVLASMIEQLARLTKRVLDISRTRSPAGS